MGMTGNENLKKTFFQTCNSISFRWQIRNTFLVKYETKTNDQLQSFRMTSAQYDVNITFTHDSRFSEPATSLLVSCLILTLHF